MGTFKDLLLKRIDTLANFYGERGFAKDHSEWLSAAKADKEYARDYIDQLEDAHYIKLKKVVRVTDFIESFSSASGHDARVLEVGCGEGRYTCVLGYTGNNVTAIDINETQVEITRKKIDDLGFKNVQVQSADANEYLRSNKGTFDIVLALDVMEHMRDPQEFCNLAYSSLVDNGFLVIIVPNGYSFAELGFQSFSKLINKKVFNREFPEGWNHIQRFSVGSIRKIINNAGFSNTIVRPTFCLTPLFIFGFRGKVASYNVKIADRFPAFLAGGWIIFCEKRHASTH